MSDGDPWTVRRLLEWTTGFFSRRAVDAPRLSAELLLAHVLKYPRIKLYTDYDRRLAEADLAAFRSLVQRAAEQEPIAYLTGRAHFFSLEFEVTRDTLIPRPDTETLVENVLQMARNAVGFEAPRVLDLCTGTGCIAAALAQRMKASTVTAVEISAKAAAVAKRNFDALGLADRITLFEGDLYEPLAGTVEAQPFQLIVANPPYIASGQIAGLDRSVKDYEPMMALDGGPDGLVFHRRILDGAADRLLGGGRVFLEIAFDQGITALEMAGGYAGFDDVRLLKDYHGKDRVLTLRRSARRGE